MCINSTLYARISPQGLSELRRLGPNVPCYVVCELVSRLVPTLCLDSGSQPSHTPLTYYQHTK